MLVLRRKVGEAITLNNVIAIRVLRVEGDRVQLGIDAPEDVVIVRDELLEESHPLHRPRINSTEVRHAPPQSRLD